MEQCLQNLNIGHRTKENNKVHTVFEKLHFLNIAIKFAHHAKNSACVLTAAKYIMTKKYV